ncbi:MAG: HIRAN domain-containing protein [Rhizonema sp. PD37]|nr:HIRAN domain-containing protein [Rhizonema sp. PD37]
MKTLFLAWQDPDSRAWFPIGRLTFDGDKYQFFYTVGAKEAQSQFGFQPMFSFPIFDKVYTSVELFPLFSNRLMQRSRPEYNNFVQWLNIPQHEDDPIAILSRSGGQKVTDHYEVFPCPKPDENGLYHIHFFIHGLRHFPPCSIERISSLKPRDVLWLAHEAQNSYDSNALTLQTEDHYILGYCPRYIAPDVLKLLQRNPKLVHVQVERINPAPTPLQFRLLCNMTAEWHDDFRPFSSSFYQPIITNNLSAYTAADNS